MIKISFHLISISLDFIVSCYKKNHIFIFFKINGIDSPNVVYHDASNWRGLRPLLIKLFYNKIWILVKKIKKKKLENNFKFFSTETEAKNYCHILFFNKILSHQV